MPLEGDAKLRIQGKLDLIDLVVIGFGAKTFADLGGRSGVEGGYSLYAASRHSMNGALVDVNASDLSRARVGRQEGLRFVQGNFTSQVVAQEVGGVDAVFLFDMLLHQPSPDWHEVLTHYAEKAHLLVTSRLR